MLLSNNYFTQRIDIIPCIFQTGITFVRQNGCNFKSSMQTITLTINKVFK